MTASCGGFATIPAYLRDRFGVMHVGAIHGRLLTAWSLAGVAGPVLVNYIREYQINHGVAKANAYSLTMYLMAGLLVIGFLCNWLVGDVDPGEVLVAAGERSADPELERGQHLLQHPALGRQHLAGAGDDQAHALAVELVGSSLPGFHHL